MEPTKKLRTTRPCAICGRVRVEETHICPACTIKWRDQLDEEWVAEMIKMSDEQARLVRRKRMREWPLHLLS